AIPANGYHRDCPESNVIEPRSPIGRDLEPMDDAGCQNRQIGDGEEVQSAVDRFTNGHISPPVRTLISPPRSHVLIGDAPAGLPGAPPCLPASGCTAAS